MKNLAKVFFILFVTTSLSGCAGAKSNSQQLDGVAKVAVANETINTKESENLVSQPNIKIPAYVPTVVQPEIRQAVIDAYEAADKKRWQDLEKLLPLASQDPVLGIFPRYWALRYKLVDRTREIPEKEAMQFLSDYPDTFLADAVRSFLILANVRKDNYSKALKIRKPENLWNSVNCALVLARHKTIKPANAKTVLDAFEPNSDCWDMLDQVVNDHVLSRQELNSLLRNTLERNKLSHANRIAAVMFDEAAMVQYAALIKKPKKWLEKQTKPTKNVDFELITIALARLARSDDREKAAKYISANWQDKISKNDMQWVWGQFGLIAALNVAPDAAKWYRKSGYVPMTHYNHAWEVRSELRDLPINWDRVANAIRKMTGDQADEPVWRYWYGRALAAQGNQAAAQQYYLSIANDFSFYGQLASEELGTIQAIPAPPPPVEAKYVVQAQQNPSLQRAVALFELGWRKEAVREWNYGLRGMDDKQLRGAADFAWQQNIYDRVVNTSLLTKSVVDFEQRFIAPFKDAVRQKADLINLDLAWIYGLIRQESRFITDAKSRVGASGLMQLMPATAKWVAKKIGMTDFKPSQVNDFDTNTILGTSYMDMVLQDLAGSQLLATAGYNAGPGRAKRWRARLQGEVEGAIFAETIPFTETRLYVKKVMSNSVYYASIFSGQPQSLKQRLGYVSPSSVTKTALP